MGSLSLARFAALLAFLRADCYDPRCVSIVGIHETGSNVETMDFSNIRFIAATLALLVVASGCAIIGVKEQREAMHDFVRIRGSVRTEKPSKNPVVVLLARVTGTPDEIDPATVRRPANLIDHFPLERPGRFAFAVQPGTFQIAAFEDRNSNLYSWLDMNPESDFIKSLFYQPPDFRTARPLPDHTEFHMMYGFNNGDESGPSSDGMLTVKNMTRIEAIEAADYRTLPLDYGHADILHSDEAASRLGVILGERSE